MKYESNLSWQGKLEEFSDIQQKLLLALSPSKYRWRTKNALAKTTGMSGTEVDRVLSELISENLVRASFSKKRNIIFGLIERVE